MLKKNLNQEKKKKIKILKKKLKKELLLNNKDGALKIYKIFQKYLDIFSRKHIISKNKSSRYKSKFIKKINLLI